MPIRIVIADDHPIVLDGLQAVFGLDPEFRVVARCANGEEAVRAVELHQPDIAVLDVRMPRMTGLQALQQLRAQRAQCRVVLLAATLEEEEALTAIREGADGILLKELAPQLLTECVRRVAAGERWLEPRSASRLVESLVRREAAAHEVQNTLTARETELVRLVAAGLRNKEISRRLGIREGTVKIHMHNIYEKLGIQNRVQLVLWAQGKGLV